MLSSNTNTGRENGDSADASLWTEPSVYKQSAIDEQTIRYKPYFSELSLLVITLGK